MYGRGFGTFPTHGYIIIYHTEISTVIMEDFI